MCDGIAVLQAYMQPPTRRPLPYQHANMHSHAHALHSCIYACVRHLTAQITTNTLQPCCTEHALVRQRPCACRFPSIWMHLCQQQCAALTQTEEALRKLLTGCLLGALWWVVAGLDVDVGQPAGKQRWGVRKRDPHCKVWQMSATRHAFSRRNVIQ